MGHLFHKIVVEINISYIIIYRVYTVENINIHRKTGFFLPARMWTDRGTHVENLWIYFIWYSRIYSYTLYSFILKFAIVFTFSEKERAVFDVILTQQSKNF